MDQTEYFLGYIKSYKSEVIRKIQGVIYVNGQVNTYRGTIYFNVVGTVRVCLIKYCIYHILHF